MQKNKLLVVLCSSRWRQTRGWGPHGFLAFCRGALSGRSRLFGKHALSTGTSESLMSLRRVLRLSSSHLAWSEKWGTKATTRGWERTLKTKGPDILEWDLRARNFVGMSSSKHQTSYDKDVLFLSWTTHVVIERQRRGKDAQWVPGRSPMRPAK